MRSPDLASPHARALSTSAIATLGSTALHHVYGGLRYATPWRVHGAVVAAVLGVCVVALSSAYRRDPATPAGRLAGWTLAILALALPVLVIGLFEGAYNHVLKNALFLAGAPHPLLLRMFPPPTYELPDDAWFEISGVAQVIPAAFTAIASLRFARGLRERREAMQRRFGWKKIAAGALVAERQLVAVSGTPVRIPATDALVHLQFRRFAGCPVCNLHLRSLELRNGEIAAAGIREVVVFHSSAEELRLHAAHLPFAVIADPDKRLYSEFGVESAARALLDLRGWPTIVRAVLRSLVAILRGRERAPAVNPHGGRLGLPADFLIASDGRVLACKYGRHADDQWEVDEILALARSAAGAPDGEPCAVRGRSQRARTAATSRA